MNLGTVELAQLKTQQFLSLRLDTTTTPFTPRRVCPIRTPKGKATTAAIVLIGRVLLPWARKTS